MKPSPRPEPIGLLVAAVRRGVRRLVEERLTGRDLSPMQFWLLVGIAEHPGRSQAEIAARARVDEATVCRAIRILTTRRLVKATRPPGDRRRLEIALAPAGQELAGELLAIAREVRGTVEAPLAPEERTALRASLQKIVAALNGHAQPADPPVARPSPRRHAVVSGLRAARIQGNTR